jgi:hypothetical protein
VIDVLQWVAIGLLGISVLLLLSVIAKHDRGIRSMAKAITQTARLSTDLAKAITQTARLSTDLFKVEMARALRQPLVYCPTHGGQEQVDGRCVLCR